MLNSSRSKTNKNQQSKQVQPKQNFTTLFSDRVEITVNGKIIIHESNVTINNETKYFIIAKNGAGKTTLLKYLYEKMKNTHDILMIDQDVQIDNINQTVKDFILDANKELYTKFKQMTELENLDFLNEDQEKVYNELSSDVYNSDWDKYSSEADKILYGLGFFEPNQLSTYLSGGWRMRLALGRALLYKPSILFLDESSNHLDLNANIWLENYLETYKNTIVMITHEIGFVNLLANYIWYIGNPESLGTKIYTIKGKYYQLQQTIKQLNDDCQKKYDKLQKRIEEMRKKTVTKKEVEDFIKKENIPRPQPKYKVNITFNNVDSNFGLKNIVEFRNVNFGYDNNQLIITNVDFSIDIKSRYVLVGKNGAGKTTLFKLISGKLTQTSGDIICDNRMKIGYYNQQILESLPLDLTPIEYLQSLKPKLDESQCRAILGKLGLRKETELDHCKTKISELSGGQKARVGFSVIQLESPEVILLDEPTNHLDIESIEALIEGINNFEGAIIVITHDTHLIESIENYVLYEINDKKVSKFSGEFDDYKNYAIEEQL